MNTDTLTQLLINALENAKAKNIVEMDVRAYAPPFDTVIIVSGTSSRHIYSIAHKVLDELKVDHKIASNHLEIDKDCTWALLDYSSVIVHILQEETRQFYNLEQLWDRHQRPSREIEY